MNKDVIKRKDISSIITGQMVEIPEGSIELRNDRTKQKWVVEIKSFLLAKFPVTQIKKNKLIAVVYPFLSIRV
ncbi:hypothetical protein TH53_24670 [Pedobacter lusitanus]|uniref:Uncharacterized protein n=1 Tax=Pedobacter lusitanus TaxID=1503925 RepID=A0A0D0GBV6_9SPHI|nr:hypothetical protein [Pedobacter lusitanus]KIO74757.1 hypothetical protein TH53_24670 [Pedobacter lusitanus]